MKTKHIAAALLAAATLGASALPAAAQDFRGRPGYGQDFRGARHEITVRTQRGAFTVDRSDRLFYRLTARPFNFRPGLSYVYTDRCNRQGCQVLVFARNSRRPIDRTFAPHVRFDRGDWRGSNPWDRDDDWRRDGDRDGRYNDRDHDRDYDRDRDGRDGRFDGRRS